MASTTTRAGARPTRPEGGLRVASSMFSEGQAIPRAFTCEGEDVSPPLRISGIPRGTRALALVVDDPDAPRGTFVHWLLWDLPPHQAELPKGVDARALGARQGRNDFGRTGYGGPCPPSGRHRYRFHAYALDLPLGLPDGSHRDGVEKAMQGHVLAEAVLTGTYQKQGYG